MNNHYFETIIVGAGPAGLAAGLFLKDAIILEKKKEIGKPVQCGEGLAIHFLKEMEIPENPAWINIKAQETQVFLPNKKIIRIPGIIYVIDRIVFENELARKIKAKLQLESRVVKIEKENNLWKVITENNETFLGKYLIGADGPGSIVRRTIFKEKLTFFPCLEYYMETEKELETDRITVFLDYQRFKNGYAWIFPKSKNSANIGLGGFFDLEKRFKEFLENEVKEFCGRVKFLQNKSGVVPIGGARISLFKDNAFLVGDAGGLADPIAGGGMGNGMISAKVASQLILNNQAQNYEKKIKSMAFFCPELLEASEIFYSLDNKLLEDIGAFLEKKEGNVYCLKDMKNFLSLLKIGSVRKNISKILKLFKLYQNYARRKSHLS